MRFTLDHVKARSAGGGDAADNLALACFHCNRRKSDRAVDVDPVTGEAAPLFNPRLDEWAAHFQWSSDLLRVEGLTPTGRATVAALLMNRERACQIRGADAAVGRHPPSGDPIAK